LLLSAGFHVVEAPAIEIVSAWDAAELARVCEGLRGGVYAWVVLQSTNAARGLPLETARVVCGAATARTPGVLAKLTLDHFSAAAALRALQPQVRQGDRILVPRAAEGRDELFDGLHSLGARVDAPVAYRTVAVAPPSVRDLQ